MRKYIFIFMLILGAMPVWAQLTASEAFASAPQGVFPLLDKNTRLDMVDYYRNGMSTASQNSLDGRSMITEMTPESITVKITDSSAAQLAVLTSPKGQIIALINTVATPGLDSNIRFYDSEWRLLDGSGIFSKPDWKEWMTAAGQENSDEVTMQVPFMLSSYRIDPVTSRLTLTNNLSRFLDKEVYESLSSYLRPSLTYDWTGKKFVLQK